jgi:hypothetical protein
MLDSAHIDWDRGIVHFEDGSLSEIVELLDSDMNTTEEPDDVEALLVEDAAGQRFIVPLGEPQSAH